MHWLLSLLIVLLIKGSNMMSFMRLLPCSTWTQRGEGKQNVRRMNKHWEDSTRIQCQPKGRESSSRRLSRRRGIVLMPRYALASSGSILRQTVTSSPLTPWCLNSPRTSSISSQVESVEHRSLRLAPLGILTQRICRKQTQSRKQRLQTSLVVQLKMPARVLHKRVSMAPDRDSIMWRALVTEWALRRTPRVAQPNNIINEEITTRITHMVSSSQGTKEIPLSLFRVRHKSLNTAKYRPNSSMAWKRCLEATC